MAVTYIIVIAVLKIRINSYDGTHQHFKGGINFPLNSATNENVNNNEQNEFNESDEYDDDVTIETIRRLIVINDDLWLCYRYDHYQNRFSGASY